MARVAGAGAAEAAAVGVVAEAAAEVEAAVAVAVDAVAVAVVAAADEAVEGSRSVSFWLLNTLISFSLLPLPPHCLHIVSSCLTHTKINSNSFDLLVCPKPMPRPFKIEARETPVVAFRRGG
jgi:hypothetical protein